MTERMSAVGIWINMNKKKTCTFLCTTYSANQIGMWNESGDVEENEDWGWDGKENYVIENNKPTLTTMSILKFHKILKSPILCN